MENRTEKDYPAWAYRGILIAATIIWGGNFVVSKFAVDAAGATWVVGIRFLIAGLLMALLLAKRLSRHLTKDLVRAGCIIGLFSFLGYWTQFLGLEGTTPAKNAFLSACYCVTVPFIWWVVVRRSPTKKNLAAAAICVAGMALVTLEGDLSVTWGDGVSILSAFMYGAEIVVIALYIRDYDVLSVTTIQMITSGILGCILGAFTHEPPTAALLADPGFLAAMAYIILLASCFASTAQNLAQTHVPPAEVSLLFALESVFGTLFSVIFYGEALTLKLVAGFILIFVGILVSQLRSKKDEG
ncbi:MAG: DMT family transporter [Eggerthellaceae bacterium]